MVFLFILFLPYGAAAFWPGGEVSGGSFDSQAEMESRITVAIADKGGTRYLSMEEYLYGCLPTVIPAGYEQECLKAQAILLRTSLIRQYREQLELGRRTVEASPDTYMTAPQRKSFWGDNYALYSEQVWKAVSSTRGIYITYEGLPIETCYFRVSAGRTRDGGEVLGRELPYLKSVACPKDYLAEEYLSSTVIKEKELEKLFGGKIEKTAMDSAGYCQSVSISPYGNQDGFQEEISGELFRELLLLSSTCFIMEKDGKNVIFTVKGAGHGLGMSQFGANEMAKEGCDYNTILSYFFQNIALDKYE